MSAGKQFEELTSGFHALQSQLRKQFLRSQALQEDIQLLSKNIPVTHEDDSSDHKQKEANHFKNNIEASMSTNHKANKFCDVIFSVLNDESKNDETQFYGIRALYAMHSTVFAVMLYEGNGIQATKVRQIEIRDKYITPAIFEIITHLFYGLNDIESCINKQNAIRLLYAADKYNIKPLKEACFQFIACKMIQKQVDVQTLCDVFNQIIDMELYDIFDEIISQTLIANGVDLNDLLLSNNEYLLKHLSFDALDKLLFDSVLKQSVSSEFQWIACLKWCKHKGSNWKELMKAFKDKIDYRSMSGQFFLTEVQSLGILDDTQLVDIMTHLLQNADTKEQSSSNVTNEEAIGFNEYDRNFSKVVVHDEVTQIITNGKKGCHWIWFANSNGWKDGKHSFSVKCNGLPSRHQTGNIVGIIGATNYELIKKKKVWQRDECILDIDFDEDSDDEDDGEKGEIVSMSFDWNGYLYKNDSMLINTEHPWTVNDEMTVIVDIEGENIKFLNNGISVTGDVEIVPSEDLVWFPILQCCGCKGHYYTCRFQ